MEDRKFNSDTSNYLRNLDLVFASQKKHHKELDDYKKTETILYTVLYPYNRRNPIPNLDTHFNSVHHKNLYPLKSTNTQYLRYIKIDTTVFI